MVSVLSVSLVSKAQEARGTLTRSWSSACLVNTRTGAWGSRTHTDCGSIMVYNLAKAAQRILPGKKKSRAVAKCHLLPFHPARHISHPEPDFNAPNCCALSYLISSPTQARFFAFFTLGHPLIGLLRHQHLCCRFFTSGPTCSSQAPKLLSRYPSTAIFLHVGHLSSELANPPVKEASTHFTVPVQGPSCEFSPCLVLPDGLELANTGSLCWIPSPQGFHFYIRIFAGKERDERMECTIYRLNTSSEQTHSHLVMVPNLKGKGLTKYAYPLS